MSTVQTKQTNLREKLAELLDFRKMRDRLSGLGLYIGKDRTGTDENLLVRGGANVDDLQIGEIAALVGGTAVDVFVYDTSRDSDGGKWRERTQHTSWYNEELNTATRGGRREFPAVAVIVAEAGKVTIYDGDDPDLSMWMVFHVNNNVWLKHSDNDTASSIKMLNAKLVTTGFRLSVVDFIDDSGYVSESSFCYEHNNISRRNIDVVGASTGNIFIVNINTNDVAMTVLPNAPIDQDTGLPVPTIAVATDGGASVIRDDGSVVDSASKSNWYRIDFYNSVLYGTLDGNPSPVYIIDDYSSDQFTQSARIYPNSAFGASDSGVALLANAVTDESEIQVLNDIALGNVGGLTLVDDKDVKTTLHAYITSKYNTGWMCGDIKLATLSDTTVETIGESSDELVVDDSGNWVGDFDAASDLDSWDGNYPGILSIVDGALQIQGSGGGYQTAYTTVNVVQGVMYQVSARYISNTASMSARVRVSSASPLGGDIINGTIKAPANDHMYTFVAPHTGTIYIALLIQDSNGNSTGVWDNISVRATTELITNGDFSKDATAANFSTTYPEWNVYNGSASVVSGKAELNGNSTTDSNLTTSVTCVIGKIYTLSADVFRVSGTNSFNLRVSESSGSIFDNTAIQSLNSLTNTSEQTATITFTATQETHYVGVQINGVSSTTIISLDNVSVRPAEDDRSVNNNGLQIIGEIDKTPVAPGADLVAYSGFSANNYLVQPYNQDLDFGTGDFSIALWFNFSAGVADQKWDDLFSLGDLGYNASSFIHAQLNTLSNYLDLYIGGFNVADKIASIGNLSRDTWNHVVFSRKNGIATAFINGSQYASKSNDKSIGGAGIEQYDLRIGYTGDNYGVPGVGFPANYSKIALFRISATAPTADQIAKIYRDEKVLFQDGAQATLYGSSDAVTALAYDQKTELLHVGTASGRSDFSGLRRINNTTTAITTSISAHNNLIAEQ